MQGYFGYPQRPVNERRVLSSSFTRNLQFRVTTVIGGDENGYVESLTPTEARFNSPRGLDIFKNGSLFVADTANHLIRLVSLSGGVSKLSGRVFQGIPQPGDSVGNRDTASFNRPQSLLLTKEGTLIVLDTENHSIKAVNSEGTTITLVGNGSEGDVNGDGSNVRLRFPSGMCLMANEDIVFCDTGNHKIKKLDKDSNVTTVAGSTIGSTNNDNPLFAQFNQPAGVAADADQNLYVCDRGNNAIRKITPSGVVTTLAGGSLGDLDAGGVEVRLNQPTDISIGFRNELYFIDFGNRVVKRLTQTGQVTSLFGFDAERFGEGAFNRLLFTSPRGIAIAESGDIYITDGNRIKKLAILP